MKKIIRRVRFKPTSTRWVCIQCTRQYSGAKPCPFCHNVLRAVKASVTSDMQTDEEGQA